MKFVVAVSTSALALGNLLTAAALAAPPLPGSPKQTCDRASVSAPADVTITSTKSINEPTKYCRIDGYVTTTNPGPNHVGFMVAMPEQWNGRYLYLVPGGAGGVIADPPAKYLSAGYAVATTDKGSQAKAILDFSFQADPARHMDFNYRGTHVAAVASQALAHSYYGRAQKYRYIAGCSAGGSGTIMEAEWFPQDGDAFIGGAVAGAVVDPDGGPPRFWGYMAQTISRNPKRWISEDDMRRVADAIMKEFDGSDGAIDGLIWDPQKIVLRRDLFPFLSDDQYAALKLLGDGFPNAEGRTMGYWLSNPLRLANFFLGAEPSPWTPKTQPRMFVVADTMARAKYGANYNLLTDMDYTKYMDSAKPVARVHAKSAPGALGPENLKPIQKTGGKIIMWIGAADDNVAPQNETIYTDAATKLYGPKRADWLRTFIAPGMYHCSGGEGQPTDMPDVTLHAAEAWVEQGKAPDFIVASNPEIERTYRLCSYPHLAHFKGGLDNPRNLDVKDAVNWDCSGRMSH